MSKKREEETMVRVDDIRRNLKELMKREIANLPELIAKLPPDQHLNVLFKLMPFVLPKVDKMAARSGESPIWSENLFSD